MIDITTTIICYKFKTLSRTEVEKMLALELQQSRVYQDTKAEGSDEKTRSLTWRELNKKVPNLPVNLKTRFDNLSVTSIDRLAEDHLTFNTIANVIAWLDLAQPNRPANH